MPSMELIITIIVAIFGSTGFWALVQTIVDKRSSKYQMLLGLGYDRLVEKCEYYIEREYITVDEYKDLFKYLYEPYIKMGGNGTAKALMEKVKKLPNAPSHIKE